MRLDGVFRGTITNHKTKKVICWEKHNAIVNSGFNWVMNLLSNKQNRPNAIGYMGFGTGTNATTSGMTGLENEVYRSSVESSWDANTKELTFTGSIPVNSNIEANIAEVGLFTENTGGVMFDRAFFTPKGMDRDSSFDYEFVIIISE